MEKLDRIFEIARLIAREKTDSLSAAETKYCKTGSQKMTLIGKFIINFKMEKIL